MRALLAAATLLLGARVWAAPAGGTMSLESKAARFRCVAPRWDKSVDEAQDEREKVYGVTLREPAAGVAAATLTVEWYAPGNGLFATPEDFLAVNASTAGAVVAGAQTGPVEKIDVHGLPARRWRFTSYRPDAPNTVRARRVATRTEQVLVESGPGFYVLTFSAPADVFDSKRPAFQRALSTFAPLPAKRTR